ncbi:MAG: acyl transferase [Chitinophagales bacterium]
MNPILNFQERVFQVTPETFTGAAFDAFRLQAEHCPVYNNFLQALDIHPDRVQSLSQLPFLPVELFKTKKILTGNANTDFYFESSGTTSEIKSKHFVHDLTLYNKSIKTGFEFFFGDISDFCFLVLLPSYLERNNASLVYMCEFLMQRSQHKNNGFYLYEYDKLISVLQENESKNTNTILIGVSFALLDLAEKFSLPLKNTIVMETGGMKGRREEITRRELHDILKKSFSVDTILSEYGMTELLSQAYAKQDGIFFTPPWMKILIRDPEDPFTILPAGKTGCINIIDLANIYSCCFIATQDLGKLNHDGSFEVLGRYDTGDIRGCNLMVE